jgi:hypothetical protein
MKILKQFTKWLNKTGTENKKTVKTDFDYTPSKDIYQEIRDIRNEAKKKYEQSSDQIKSMSTTIGHLPGSSITSGNPLWASGKTVASSYVTSPTITTSSLSSSAITINGDPTSGSMRVDVPLIVNGRDVMKELDEMRDVLLLLKRNVEMEAKYPKLKELKEEYEAALAKYKTFEALK